MEAGGFSEQSVAQVRIEKAKQKYRKKKAEIIAKRKANSSLGADHSTGQNPVVERDEADDLSASQRRSQAHTTALWESQTKNKRDSAQLQPHALVGAYPRSQSSQGIQPDGPGVLSGASLDRPQNNVIESVTAPSQVDAPPCPRESASQSPAETALSETKQKKSSKSSMKGPAFYSSLFSSSKNKARDAPASALAVGEQAATSAAGAATTTHSDPATGHAEDADPPISAPIVNPAIDPLRATLD